MSVGSAITITERAVQRGVFVPRPGVQFASKTLIEFFQENVLWFALIPLLSFIPALPYLVMRFYRGWRLVHRSNRCEQSDSFKMEDLFLLGGIFASLIVLFRNAAVFSSVSQAIETGFVMFVPGLLLMGVSTVFGVPAAWLAFRCRRIWIKWLSLSALYAFALVAFGVFGWSVATVPGENWLNVVLCTIGTTTATATLLSLFSICKWMGLAIIGKESAVTGDVSASQAQVDDRATPLPTTSHPLDDVAPHEGSKSLLSKKAAESRRTIRIQFASVVALVILTGLAAARMEFKKVAAVRKQQSIADEFKKRDGGVEFDSDGNVVAITAGPNTTDAEVIQFNEYPKLTKLSLAHSRITDACIQDLAALGGLYDLDLSYTAVTDEGLNELKSAARELRALKLNGTQISCKAVSEFLLHRPVTAVSTLEFGDRTLTDADLAGLPPVPILSLARTQITDRGLKQYLRNGGCLRLDVSYTDIDGSGIVPKGSQLTHVNLDGTKLKQSEFDRLFLSTGAVLSVKETQVRLPVVPPGMRISGLRLGGGAIDEAELVRAGGETFEYLGLQGKEFTGACFQNNSITVSYLDLSGSGITDEQVKHLRMAEVVALDLSNTQVSDACLPYLESCTAQRIDLRDTKITAEGLLKSLIPPHKTLALSCSQFSAEDFTQLKAKFRVTEETGETQRLVKW
ncbi:MAG: hypothetical protein U0892_03300 [Pirellulales bacterium]